VRRTWAPRGQTPILRHSYRHDRISAISAISVSPRRRRLGLFYRLHDHNIRRPDVCRFLSQLLRHLRGPLIVVWDNLGTHKGPPIEAMLRRNRRLRLEHFPAYAPELNPDEGVWNLLESRLANGQPENQHRLWGALLLELECSNSKIFGTLPRGWAPASATCNCSPFCGECCDIYAVVTKAARSCSPHALHQTGPSVGLHAERDQGVRYLAHHPGIRNHPRFFVTFRCEAWTDSMALVRH